MNKLLKQENSSVTYVTTWYIKLSDNIGPDTDLPYSQRRERVVAGHSWTHRSNICLRVGQIKLDKFRTHPTSYLIDEE